MCFLSPRNRSRRSESWFDSLCATGWRFRTPDAYGHREFDCQEGDRRTRCGRHAGTARWNVDDVNGMMDRDVAGWSVFFFVSV